MFPKTTVKKQLFLFIFLVSSNITLSANIGKWGDNLTFQMIPVSAALSPQTNELLLWSAFQPRSDDKNGAGQTIMAAYNLSTKEIRNMTVTETGHDMFCPGISLTFDGSIIVTGGSTDTKTSIYNGSWSSGGAMKMPRGYQSTATTSEGKVFTIGGSWPGKKKELRDGEIWDPETNTWSLLPGCLVKFILTHDNNSLDPENRSEFYRSDNHAWLFPWSNGSVFQAGPSMAMNWYSTIGNGSVTPAGMRTDEMDQMCGSFVMYDAVAGKILTAGGAQDYQDSVATNIAHVITVSQAYVNATVKKIQAMNHSRTFANSVILPDGKIFIVGGQPNGKVFTDVDPVLIPEIWDPDTETFTDMAKGSTPRTYHSVALLMPDATVFSGGGGLCGPCNANHLDGQFYWPPYLFENDGETVAIRPIIESIPKEIKVGESIEAKVKVVGTSGNLTFSMVRVGSTTHTVNTDQRRVPLSTSSTASPYTFTLPSDPGVLLPGYWMFFALEDGVPSVGEFIKVTL